MRLRLVLLPALTAAVALPGRADVSEDFKSAVVLYDQSKYSEARKIFARIDAALPNDTETNFYLGRLDLWFDQGADGLARLEKAERNAPNDARIQNALGDAYGLQAQKAALFSKLSLARKCLAAYKRAEQLDPGNVDYHWSLLLYYQLAPAFLGGGLARAEAEVAEIGRLDPNGGRIAAGTLDVVEHKFDQAFAEFEAVLKVSPGDFMALYHVGRCAALSGEHREQGIEALRHCLQLPQPPGAGKPKYVNVHYRLGTLLAKAGDAAGAKAEYHAALADNPEFRPAEEELKN